MSELNIKVSTIIRELLILLGIFAFAFLFNVYAITQHDGQWSELVTQLHIVLYLTLILFVLITVIRGIVWGIIKLVRKYLNGSQQQNA